MSTFEWTMVSLVGIVAALQFINVLLKNLGLKLLKEFRKDVNENHH